MKKGTDDITITLWSLWLIYNAYQMGRVSEYKIFERKPENRQLVSHQRSGRIILK
jgi:hypothetical protein